MREIARGAEAILYLDKGLLIKNRIKKKYRINEIDNSLRITRTKKEANLLEKSSKLINAPKVISIENEKIKMEFIKGKLLRDVLNNMDNSTRKKACIRIGMCIKMLHENDIIHGDLTTSNFILKNNLIYFIDFGLGFVSSKAEDKAVDVHLLKQALYSKHHEIADECFSEIFKNYNPSAEFIERFDKVERRGRYKAKKVKGKS